MVEFPRKFENCGVNIIRVKSILITNSINLSTEYRVQSAQLFTLILFGVWCPLCSDAIFPARSNRVAYASLSINREAYAHYPLTEKPMLHYSLIVN